MSRASSEDTVVEDRRHMGRASQRGAQTASTGTPSVSSTPTNSTTPTTNPSIVDLRPRPLRDDTNRGKRLMGNLLGSLQGGQVRRSQTKEMTKSDIEARIRNRANKSNSEENRALKETILRKRRERKALEMSRRHEQMRKDARFLQTHTKPVITFLPRVLTPEDTAQINEQCRGVEYDIQRELAEREEVEV